MNAALSILIRTFNSAATLGEVLTRLDLAAGDEVIVVDSGSKDATLEIARRQGARIVLAEGPFNYSRSLNLGFQAARNPWVLVLSSHCVPLTGDLLARFRGATHELADPVAVVYGECCLIDAPPRSEPRVVLVDEHSPRGEQQRVYGGNGLALYRRGDWEKRPFDESLPTAEDLDWFLRALREGRQAARLPAARVLYRNHGSLRHMFRKGRGEARLAQQLAGFPPMTWPQLALSWGALAKKWLTGKLPASACVRQAAHALGACLSAKFTAESARGNHDSR